MPVTVVCPACNAKLKAPDNLIGKAVKCPACSKPVLVKAPASAAPPPAPAPVKKPVKQPAPIPDEEPIEDIEDLDEEPVRAPVKKAGKQPAPDLDDDDEPIEDVDSIEDELDSPRPKKKKKKGSSAGAIEGGPSTDKERGTAMWIHLFPIVLGWCCGIGNLLALIMWVTKRKESAFIDHHGKAWLNWFINLFVAGILFGIVSGVLQFIGGMLGSTVAWIVYGLIVLLSLAFGVAVMIMQIMVALKAKKGEWAEYKVLFKVLK